MALAVCALTFTPAPAFAGGSPTDAYLDEWQQSNSIPGVAVAVLDGDDEDVWLLGNDGHADPITSSTPFLIGSVAKTITGTIVLQLVDDGRVALDDTARTHLTWLEHDATIRQLLDHTAGYSAQDGLAVSERYREQLTVTGAARELDHSGEIGSYSYSSANYLVLGALIEQVTGNSFADELHQRITRHVGMDDSGVDGVVPGLPPGHRLWWGSPVAYDPGSEPSGAPYGYLVSTLDDLMAYSRAQLDAGLIPDELRAAAWSDQSGTDSGQGYGLGWRIDVSDGTLRIHHTGATPGYFAHVMLMPEEDRAVIVLANAYSEAGASSLAAAAADIDRLSQGDAAAPRAGDAVLTMLPWMALALAGLAILAFIAGTLRHPRTRTVTASLMVGSVLVALALTIAPMLMGTPWHVISTWTPDAALGLVASIIAWLAVALLLLVRVWRFRPAPARQGV
ncbi:penicillin-binding protein [Pseudoclavibacter endophyticus]|nr:penicillin-binding protein [Pseudoclavibacter endophyticus]